MSGQGERPRSARGGSSNDASPDPGLDRVISGRHLDDQYHGHETYTGTSPDEDEEEEDEEHENNGEADLSRDDSATGEADAEKEPGEDGEARGEPRVGILGGPPSDKDLEAGQLEKAKTSNSKRSKMKDPNLVRWKGLEDPENPKNWPLRRKWAATLVGKSNLIYPQTVLYLIDVSFFIYSYLSGILVHGCACPLHHLQTVRHYQ